MMGVSSSRSKGDQNSTNKADSRLFALLIGINTYNCTRNVSDAQGTVIHHAPDSAERQPKFDNLNGSVVDAKNFEKYLVEDLHVPQSHITSLHDKKATRDRIIKAFQDIATDNRIQRGDSIFIFFAGHGAQAYPPQRLIGTPGCPERVELLIPHDYHKDPANVRNMGIPDYSLAALLNKIAKEKGDNITIVFDCCHSASALRGLELPPSQEQTLTRSGPELNYYVPDDLDEDIWGSRTRGLTVLPGLKYMGISSYGGWFTQALLAYLKTLGPNGIKVPCSQIITGLQKIDGQHPQCEGFYSKTRPIFHGYSPSHVERYFDIHYWKPNSTLEVMTLQGGDIHGLAEDDELTVYATKLPADLKQSIGTVVVDRVSFDASSLRFKTGSPTFSSSMYPHAVALLSKWSAKKPHHLAIYVDLKEPKLASRVEAFGGCTLSRNLQEAQIRLSSSTSFTSEKQLRFEVVDAELLGRGIKLKPNFTSDTEEDLTHVLKGLTHYYYHLKRTSTSLATDKISVSLYEVQDRGFGHPQVVKANDACNLCPGGAADITVVADAIYGLEITNNTEYGGNLFPVLLYFDNVEFTVSRKFPHTVLEGNTESPWPASRQSMTIGYGVGPGSSVNPFSFYLTEGNDVEAGFFKLFLSDRPVDLQTVEQDEPVFARSRGLTQKPLRKVHQSTACWGSITIPVIQRRGR